METAHQEAYDLAALLARRCQLDTDGTLYRNIGILNAAGPGTRLGELWQVRSAALEDET